MMGQVEAIDVTLPDGFVVMYVQPWRTLFLGRLMVQLTGPTGIRQMRAADWEVLSDA